MESTPAKLKRSRVFRNSIAARLVCRARSPFRQHEKTPPATDRRSLARSGAALGSSEVLRMGGEPGRRNSLGDTAVWPTSFAKIGCLSVRQVDSGGAKTEPTPPKSQRRPTLWSPWVSVPPEWGDATTYNPRSLTQSGAASRSFALVRCLSVWPVDSAGKITEATLPTWRGVHSVSHDRFFFLPPGRLPRTSIY